MKDWELGVIGSLLCGQIQALPGPGRGLPPLPPAQAVPTREAAVLKLVLRPFPDEWAACSEPVCSSEAGSHWRPRGKTNRRGRPGWKRAAHSSREAKNHLYCGEGREGAPGLRQHGQPHRWSCRGPQDTCRPSRRRSQSSAVALCWALLRALLWEHPGWGGLRLSSINLKVISFRCNLLIFVVAYVPPRNLK